MPTNFQTAYFCAALTPSCIRIFGVNVCFFLCSAPDKHKLEFYVYKTTRLFYVTRGSTLLMFRCIYNPPQSLRTSPLHYFSKSVLPRLTPPKILRGRFVSYYRTKSTASHGPAPKSRFIVLMASASVFFVLPPLPLGATNQEE